MEAVIVAHRYLRLSYYTNLCLFPASWFFEFLFAFVPSEELPLRMILSRVLLFRSSHAAPPLFLSTLHFLHPVLECQVIFRSTHFQSSNSSRYHPIRKHVRFEIFPHFLQLCWGYCATFECRPHFHGLNCCSFDQVCSNSGSLPLALSHCSQVTNQGYVPYVQHWEDCWTSRFIISWTGIQANEQLS